MSSNLRPDPKLNYLCIDDRLAASRAHSTFINEFVKVACGANMRCAARRSELTGAPPAVSTYNRENTIPGFSALGCAGP